MLTQRTAINRVEQFACEVQSTGLHLRKVILFGSYTSDKQGEWSGIDVALVADEIKGDPFIDEIKHTGIEIKVDCLKSIK